jgi:glucan 1,3-beta-glucosidase
MLQIGYYHLCEADPSVLRNTIFHDLEYVFTGAWTRITRAIEMARHHGIGVLLDLIYASSRLSFGILHPSNHT